MRKIFFILIIILSISVLFAFQGFRDIPWGSSISYVRKEVNPYFEYYTDVEGHCVMATTEEIMGQQVVVAYNFIDGDFFMVLMLFRVEFGEIYDMYHDVKDALETKYGQPTFTDNPWISEYFRSTYEGETSYYDTLAMWGVYKPFNVWIVHDGKSMNIDELKEKISLTHEAEEKELVNASERIGEDTIIKLVFLAGNKSMEMKIAVQYYQGKLHAEYTRRQDKKRESDIESTF